MGKAETQKKEPTLLVSIIPVVLTIAVLAIGILRYEVDVHIPLVIGTVITSLIAVYALGYTWNEIQDGIVESIKSTLSAILILGVIGIIIGTWILGGVVPTLIYYGLQILSPGFFLVASVLLCSVVSLGTGSSWTTAGTVGIALIGIARGLNIPEGLAAGAIISGAYFGDKMSPLSDTTNLAPAMAGSDLFDHIKHMVYTTGVSYVLTLIIFGVLGLSFSGAELNVAEINVLLDTLKASYNITPVLLLIPVIVIVLVVMKVPALPGLLLGSVLGGIGAMMFQGADVGAVITSMMYGVESATGNEVVDSLLSRGGMQSMMWTISLIICALSFGGVLERTGMLQTIARKLLSFAQSTGSLIFVTIISCIFINVLAGDQYLAIALPGKMYKDEYKKRGLAPRNLSRALEDSGTVTSALVPWNTCGATMSTSLGVPVQGYFMYAFFNLLSPIVSAVFGFTGITIMRIENDPSSPEYKGTKKK